MEPEMNRRGAKEPREENLRETSALFAPLRFILGSITPSLLLMPASLLLGKRIAILGAVFIESQRLGQIVGHGWIRITHTRQIRRARLRQQEFEHTVVALASLQFRDPAF